MSKKLYASRDVRGLEKYYTDHVMAMTAEGLHSKSDIAAELAYRDQQRDRLLTLATKWCDKDHHDWQEILHIAGTEKGNSDV